MRCFGVIEAKWSMIAHPSRLWSASDTTDVMYACVIMHNMIIEYENDEDLLVLNVSNSSQSRLRCGVIFNDLQVGTNDLHDLKHTTI